MSDSSAAQSSAGSVASALFLLRSMASTFSFGVAVWEYEPCRDVSSPSLFVTLACNEAAAEITKVDMKLGYSLRDSLGNRAQVIHEFLETVMVRRQEVRLDKVNLTGHADHDFLVRAFPLGTHFVCAHFFNNKNPWVLVKPSAGDAALQKSTFQWQAPTGAEAAPLVSVESRNTEVARKRKAADRSHSAGEKRKALQADVTGPELNSMVACGVVDESGMLRVLNQELADLIGVSSLRAKAAPCIADLLDSSDIAKWASLLSTMRNQDTPSNWTRVRWKSRDGADLSTLVRVKRTQQEGVDTPLYVLVVLPVDDVSSMSQIPL